jgi:hypothetical protein
VQAPREVGFLVAVSVDCCCWEDAVEEWGWGARAIRAAALRWVGAVRDLIAEYVPFWLLRSLLR